MIYLEGFSEYYIVDYSIKHKIGDFDYLSVEISPQYFYNIKYETGKVKLIQDGKTLFTGVVTDIDYNYSDGTLFIKLTEYIKILSYLYDLFGSSPAYSQSYSSTGANTIATAILNSTIFSLESIYDVTITKIEGVKLDRFEWLRLLADNMECGLDANGDYTTNPTNIVSNERNQDIIVNYIDDEVTFGVKGCYRKSISGEPYIWTQKVLTIDDYIEEIDELQDSVYKTKRIIVIGNDETIYGSAYVTSATDVPVEVITDTSCMDEASCIKRAQDELNMRYSIDSLSIKVTPKLYYDGNIEVGMKIIINEPYLFNNEYLLSGIDVTSDSVSLTLGSPKKRLITSLNELNKRVRKLERW